MVALVNPILETLRFEIAIFCTTSVVNVITFDVPTSTDPSIGIILNFYCVLGVKFIISKGEESVVVIS